MLDLARRVIAGEGGTPTKERIVYISKRIRQCLLYLQDVEQLVRPIKLPGERHLGWVKFDSAVPRDLLAECPTLRARKPPHRTGAIGRPRILDDERVEVARGLIEREGLTVAAAAKRIGSSRGALWHRLKAERERWKRANP